MIFRNLAFGALAGAAGSAVLNAVSYADMAVRGRPPSSLPEDMVTQFARRLHVRALGKPPEELSAQEHNRRSGVAALLGYIDGIGTGAVYGVLRPVTPRLSWFWAGIALAILTMAASEGTATVMGQTDPRSWGLAGWLSDIVPRCFYGWTTAISCDLLAGGS